MRKRMAVLGLALLLTALTATASTVWGADAKITIALPGGVKLEMVKIAAGQYTMGANGKEADEKPPHEVSLDGFYLGKYEVTQAQWKAVMGENPSHFGKCGVDCPVEKVSWNDVQDFIDKLNNATGKKFRLPTEAEWEYACRAGGSDRIDLGDYAWYSFNSESKTHPVGQKSANAWGLYDMRGNVWEWCQDSYQKDFYQNSPKKNPLAKSILGGDKVARGGCWFSAPGYCRSAYRSRDLPAKRSNHTGLRLVLPLEE